MTSDDQVFGSKESVVVKEKDDVFTASSDELVPDRKAKNQTHSEVTTPPAAATPAVTTLSYIAKSDMSPPTPTKTKPKTEPLLSTAVTPPTSTGTYIL